MRADTKLKNKYDNNSGDDFAMYDDFGQGNSEGDDGQLAKEFYQELEYRQSQQSDLKDDETYTIRARDRSISPQNNIIDGSDNNTIRTVRIQAGGNTMNIKPSTTSSGTRRTFTNQSTKASQSPSPAFPLFPFFSFPSPAPRPAASAGLFSGSGATVYSSGRSVRAEIEILETRMKNTEAQNNSSWDNVYVGSPEQMEEVLRLVAVSLIVLSAAYVSVEAYGGLELVTWDGAAASANHVMGLMTDATKDGMSGIISVTNGDVFLGEDAAWLMKESSSLAASVVNVVRSVEELVLT